MSLKDKYKTDGDAVREGVWFDFDTNSDGTVPGFKLAFAGKQNKKYTAAMRKWTAKYEDDNGIPDFSTLQEADADKFILEVFADTVLIDWRNFQPEDDGVNVPYSRDAVVKIFGSDDWAAFYAILNAKAKKVANFRQKALVAQAKNS